MINNNEIKFKVKNDSKIKKEVSNDVFLPVINAAKTKGIEFKDLLNGVPYDESYFSDKRERVGWSTYCKILSNMRPYFSLYEFEKIGADFVRSGSFIDGLVGFLLFTSNKTSKFFAAKILKRITSHILCLNTQIEFIDSYKIRFTLQLDDGYEHIPEFAYANRGLIRELGNLAGLRGCKVELKFIPQGAVYDMSWKKKNIFFGLIREFHWLFNIDRAFWEMTDAHEELLREYEKLEDYKNNLEIKVDERTAELKTAHDELSETIKLLKEAQQIQNHFFANISHEFRTPLTLILGPVKQTMESAKDDKLRDEMKVVYRNAKRLLNLVNQLLDISKLESGEMKLQTSFQDIIPLLKALFQSFISYAERKKIILNFSSVEDKIMMYIDKDKIEKIITNILSNAFKFTPEGGQIDLCLEKDERFVSIVISDTGIGIPKDKISRVFDRFYQVNGSHIREQEGTGIGLSLTKELIELHKGMIEIESEEGRGTSVRVFIPLGIEHVKEAEVKIEVEEEWSCFQLEVGEFERNKSDEFNYQLFTEKEKPVLLIIEDNSDVREYIKSNIESDFRVLEAIDGEDGWSKSIENMPDLIISDIMMPKLDGFKLCEKLKTDKRTSHIPVIILTAKATSKDKIEGYETGADDYIMKPFETEELRARIKNLIEQRKRIHEHFKKHGLFEVEEETITSIDQKFLKKTIEIITEHISEPSFGVETLAKEMAVSRSLLLKKIEALTGEPPTELIKRIRLVKAAKLIESKFGTISQISLEVGFSNPSYFAECFKKQFGISPSQFRQDNSLLAKSF